MVNNITLRKSRIKGFTSENIKEAKLKLEVLTLNCASRSAWPSMISISSCTRSGGAFSPNMLKLIKKSINILNSAPVTSCKLCNTNQSNHLGSSSRIILHLPLLLLLLNFSSFFTFPRIFNVKLDLNAPPPPTPAQLGFHNHYTLLPACGGMSK